MLFPLPSVARRAPSAKTAAAMGAPGRRRAGVPQASGHPGKSADELARHLMDTFRALCGNIDEVRPCMQCEACRAWRCLCRQ